MTESKVLDRCLICTGQELELILDLGDQPLSSVFPLPDETDPVSSPLKLMRCISPRFGSIDAECGNVQLSHQASFTEMYGMNYGYNSSLSPLMLKHLSLIRDRILELIDVESESIILDIGCNDGSFLAMFLSHTKNLIGVDPSSSRFLDKISPDVHVIEDFFPTPKLNEFLLNRKVKVVSSIAMFYDLYDPLKFIQEVYDQLDESGLWVVELAELNEFLKNLSYDQICHEHLLYIDNQQMIQMAESVGFRLMDITYSEINGGSSCYFFSKDSARGKQTDTSKVTRGQLLQLSRRVHQNKANILDFLSILRKQDSRIMGYGASTKGNVLINFFGLNSSYLEAISDINSFKWGRVTPGSRIPIISHEEMRAFQPDYLFCFIWHLRLEVLRDEKDFIEKGGKIIFPLPRLHVIDRENYHLYVDFPLNDLAFDISTRELTL
jgi:NDP-4-keto-2,6-dideoxyhexose 3-C-methyltransferase